MATAWRLSWLMALPALYGMADMSAAYRLAEASRAGGPM